MTVGDFKALFPEFANAPEPLVESILAQEEVFMSNAWTEDQHEVVLGLRVADALTLSPFGSNQRLVDTKKQMHSTYRIKLERIYRMNAFAKNRVG